MNITSLGFSSRCLNYVVPAILFGILFTQMNFDSQNSESSLVVETKVKGKIFPANWYDAPVYASAQSLEKENQQVAVEEMRPVIEVYPDHLIKKNLQKVYLLSDLQMYGSPCGSLNSNHSLYICRPNWKKRCAKEVVAKHFHSRFSRILQINYKDSLDLDKWTSINPKGFRYGENKSFKAGEADLSTSDPENGFVCRYAKVSADADFAMVSANLLIGKQELWSMASRYPRIEQKMALVIQFYQSLDPKLNKEYFRSLASKKAPCCKEG